MKRDVERLGEEWRKRAKDRGTEDTADRVSSERKWGERRE